MKIIHDPEIDYVSINFKDGVEAKSILKDGIIARLDKKGHVLGIDITDSSQFFLDKDEFTLKEACHFLKISQTTLRKKIKQRQIKCIREGRSIRIKKSDMKKLAS